METTIDCRVCARSVPHIGLHLKDAHPEMSVEHYRRIYPDAPLMSEMMAQRIAAKKAQTIPHAGTVTSLAQERKLPLHELFELGDVPAARNALGKMIEIAILPDTHDKALVPDIDYGFVYDIALLKQIIVAFERNIPLYLWGTHGVGKTAVIQQVSARTNRPTYRVQHTIGMIESDILGGWRAKDGNTYFDLGPLPLAMMHGWVYLCDEYDRAPPGVVSLYQAVLERQPLVIKEAPPEWRVIKPHKNFRFAATGNTNGSGDDTGLYVAAQVGDAANYSRFGITERVMHLPQAAEVAMLRGKQQMPKGWTEDLVTWANLIRSAFDSGKLSTTVGPRELLYAAEVGVVYANMKIGIRSAVINRMNSIDRVTAEELLQRVFG